MLINFPKHNVCWADYIIHSLILTARWSTRLFPMY
jgi:hypothetical protein